MYHALAVELMIMAGYEGNINMSAGNLLELIGVTCTSTFL